MIDMNDVDSLGSTTQRTIGEEIIDREELAELEDNFKEQYMSLNNLGTDLSKDVEDKYKVIIFGNMLEYVNNTYINITEMDVIAISPQKRLQIGQLVYNFICVDLYSTLIPNYLESIKCFDLKQFDLFVKNNLSNGDKFKTSFIKIIENIYKRLNNLQKLTGGLQKNSEYISLLSKFTYYIELVNFGDSNNLLFNYIRPVLIKDFDDMTWRTFT